MNVTSGQKEAQVERVLAELGPRPEPGSHAAGAWNRAFVLRTYHLLSIREQCEIAGLARNYMGAICSRLIQSGDVRIERRPGQRPWLSEDDDRMDRLLRSGLSLDDVSRVLGRSYNALMQRLQRRGTSADEIRDGAVWSLEQVARLFQVSGPTASRWRDMGWLPTRRNGPEFLITRLDLEQFVAEHRAWPSYRTEKIRDAAIRKRAEDARRQAVGQWINLAEYARRAGYCEDYVQQLASAGRIAGEKVGNRWYFWVEKTYGCP